MTNENEVLLKSYKWGELWSIVKDKGLPRSDEEIALSALLLSSWWNLHLEAEQELGKISSFDSPIIKFSIAYINMGRSKHKFSEFYDKLEPGYLKGWLRLEYLGRSVDLVKQAKLSFSLLKKHGKNATYIRSALFQSLDHEYVKPRIFKKYFFDKIPANLACSKDSILQYKLGLIPSIKWSEKEPESIFLCAKYEVQSGNLDEGIRLFDILAKTGQLDFIRINLWLGLSISCEKGLGSFTNRADFAYELVPDTVRSKGIVHSYKLIYEYLRGDYKAAYQLVSDNVGFTKLRVVESDKAMKTLKIFFEYTLALCVFWQKNQRLYKITPNTQITRIIGESHSMPPSRVKMMIAADTESVGSTSFIMGIKMFHLSDESSSHNKYILRDYFSTLISGQNVILTIGEIDTRPDEGIWAKARNNGFSYRDIVMKTVKDYVKFVSNYSREIRKENIILQGVPAPGYGLVGVLDPGDKKQFLEMIRFVNFFLRKECLEAGFSFLDVYGATASDKLVSNGIWHLDGFHLKPNFYYQAYNWIIKPFSLKNT